MRNSSQGFTLIEVLLGVVIFSIAGLAVYSTFATGIQLDRRAEATSRVYREAHWALNQIAYDLERVTGYDFTNSYPKRLAFEGKENSMSFITRSSTGLKVVKYYLSTPELTKIHKVIVGQRQRGNRPITVAKTEEEHALRPLMREEKGFVHHLQPGQPVPQQRSASAEDAEILSMLVVDGSLKFFYAFLEGEKGNEKIVWKSSWGEVYLPAGVRVEFTLKTPERTTTAVTFHRHIFIPAGFWGQK